MRILALLCLLWVATGEAVAANPQTFVDAGGVYPLIGHGTAATNWQVTNLLSDPYTAGVSVRTEWWTLEPTDNSYDWSYIDSFIARAESYNKKIMLRVRPAWQTPAWVYGAGAAEIWYYERNDSDNLNRMPLPWDPVYLEKWTEFVAALGARYDNHPTVAHILITGCSRSDCEMYLPTPGDLQAGQPTWEQAGYSPGVMIDAWKQVIDAWVAAFPNTLLSISCSTVLYDDGVVEVVSEYAANNYPWHVAQKISFWHNNNSTTYYPLAAMLSQVDERTFGGEEAVGAIGDGGEADFVDAVADCIGWKAVLWMEPYYSQRVYLAGYFAENQKYKAMVSSTTFNASDGEDGQSQLTWANPSGYTGFSQVKILRRMDRYPAGPDDAQAAVVYQGTGQSLLDSDLISNATYYYSMYELPSGYTIAQDTGLPVDNTPPSNPANLTAIPAYQGATLDWDDNSDIDLQGYNVYRSATSGSGYAKINTGTVTVSTYSDHSAPAGVTQYYIVRAVDEVPNESGNSNEVSVVPKADSGVSRWQVFR